MSNKKWTDGPWEVINGCDVFGPLGGHSGDGVKCDDSDGWHVASCDPRPSFVGGELVDLGYDVAKANANLMAAAPEIYKELEEFDNLSRDIITALLAAGGRDNIILADKVNKGHPSRYKALAKARGE